MKYDFEVICINDDNCYKLQEGKTYLARITDINEYIIYDLDGLELSYCKQDRFKVKEKDNKMLTMELKPLPVKNEEAKIDNNGDFTHAVTMSGVVNAIFTDEINAKRFYETLILLNFKTIEIREIA